jgi:F0F1-type ATP synthase alpha subunit
VPTPRVREFESQFYRFLETERPAILTELGQTATLTDELAKALADATDDFRQSFLA